MVLQYSEAAARGALQEKLFLEILQNLQENTCVTVSFLIKLQAFIKKETLAQVFSCEFCEISKSTFFTEHIWATASEYYQLTVSFHQKSDVKKKLFHMVKGSVSSL